MLETGSICQCCKDHWLNEKKEPLVMREITDRKTTEEELSVYYCSRCDSGGRGDGVHEQILRRSSE